MKRIAVLILLAGCSVTSIDAEFKAKLDACEQIEDEHLRSECIQNVEYSE